MDSVTALNLPEKGTTGAEETKDTLTFQEISHLCVYPRVLLCSDDTIIVHAVLCLPLLLAQPRHSQLDTRMNCKCLPR